MGSITFFLLFIFSTYFVYDGTSFYQNNLSFDINSFFMVTTADNGRVYIPKDLREKFGEQFHIVERDDGIVLVPVSDDPLEALRDEFSDVDKTVDELKEGGLKQGMEEAGK